VNNCGQSVNEFKDGFLQLYYFKLIAVLITTPVDWWL
jgi:hypothetical protein